MAAPIAAKIGMAMASSGKGKGDGDSGYQSGFDPLKKGTGDIGGFVSSVSNYRRQKKEDDAAKEYANQLASQNRYDYGRAMDAHDRSVDLAPTFHGVNAADYESSAFHVPTSRDQIGGGALESMLGSSFGYNPTMEHNPYLNVFDADKAAVSALKGDAEQRTEQTLSDWEASQGELAGQLDDAYAAIRDDRDKMVADYEAAMADSREQERADMAQRIVEAWAASKDSASAGDFVDAGRSRRSRRWGRALGALGGAALGPGGEVVGGAAGGARGRGDRVSGAKKEAYIEERLAAGDSYEDILSDPEFVETHIRPDKTAGDLYGSWEDR